MIASPPASAQAVFAERYLLARYESGGVVIDLESGNYYRINGTAALVCDALLRAPDLATAASSVANELRIDPREAARIVEQVAADLDVPRISGEIQGSYHFYPNESGYELRHGSNRVLDISADGSHVRIAAGAPPASSSQLELYVRALAPKLLFQNQITVLHASACVVAGKVIAFAGVSGSGKTTTARAYAAAGATLISEDLLVLAPGDAASVVTRGESVVQEWAREVTSRLLGDRGQAVAVAALASDAVRGPTIRLHSMLFLDRGRRAGSEFRSGRLEEADALAEILRHDFLGAAEVASWRRFFQAAVALLGQIEARKMWAPTGVDGLAAAADRYTSRTAS